MPIFAYITLRNSKAISSIEVILVFLICFHLSLAYIGLLYSVEKITYKKPETRQNSDLIHQIFICLFVCLSNSYAAHLAKGISVFSTVVYGLPIWE